jgi:hypothetical protein
VPFQICDRYRDKEACRCLCAFFRALAQEDKKDHEGSWVQSKFKSCSNRVQNLAKFKWRSKSKKFQNDVPNVTKGPVSVVHRFLVTATLRLRTLIRRSVIMRNFWSYSSASENYLRATLLAELEVENKHFAPARSKPLSLSSFWIESLLKS